MALQKWSTALFYVVDILNMKTDSLYLKNGFSTQAEAETEALRLAGEGSPFPYREHIVLQAVSYAGTKERQDAERIPLLRPLTEEERAGYGPGSTYTHTYNEAHPSYAERRKAEVEGVIANQAVK